jgi:TonB family protein
LEQKPLFAAGRGIEEGFLLPEVSMKRNLVALLLVLSALALLATSQVIVQPAVRISSDVMQGLVVTKIAPIYPPLARQARIQGTVILKVRINAAGDIGDMQLVSGHPLLAPAAIEAVKQWKYRPYLLNGDPVEVETQVTVNFSLSGKPAPGGVAGDVPGGVAPGGEGGLGAGNPEDQTHPATPQRVRISSGVAQGLLVTKVPPQYPQEAKDQGIQGVVVMKVTVDKEGNVENIQLMSGHPLLVPPAIEAVKQWKYKPYLVNGTPVEVETQVRVTFTLVS